MSFTANIGAVWAGYNIYPSNPDASLNPTPTGLVACNGDCVIPDDPSLGAGYFTALIASNFLDANGFWTSNAGYTMTTPAAYFNGGPNPVPTSWIGQGIPAGNQANNFLWLDPAGSLVVLPQLGIPAFWPSLDWSALGTIPDLSALVCGQDMCDPDVLIQSAKAFQQIPAGLQEAAITYLIALWAGGSMDPTTLMQDAKTFLGKVPPGFNSTLQTYLLAQIAGGTLDPDALMAAAKTFQKLRGFEREIQISLLCQIANP